MTREEILAAARSAGKATITEGEIKAAMLAPSSDIVTWALKNNQSIKTQKDLKIAEANFIKAPILANATKEGKSARDIAELTTLLDNSIHNGFVNRGELSPYVAGYGTGYRSSAGRTDADLDIMFRPGETQGWRGSDASVAAAGDSAFNHMQKGTDIGGGYQIAHKNSGTTIGESWGVGALTLASMIVLPGLGAAGALVAGGAAGAASVALQGGGLSDMYKGAAIGGIGSAIGMSGLSPLYKAGAQAALTAATGGDLKDAAVSGVSSYAGSQGGKYLLDTNATSAWAIANPNAFDNAIKLGSGLLAGTTASALGANANTAGQIALSAAISGPAKTTMGEDFSGFLSGNIWAPGSGIAPELQKGPALKQQTPSSFDTRPTTPDDLWQQQIETNYNAATLSKAPLSGPVPVPAAPNQNSVPGGGRDLTIVPMGPPAPASYNAMGPPAPAAASGTPASTFVPNAMKGPVQSVIPGVGRVDYLSGSPQSGGWVSPEYSSTFVPNAMKGPVQSVIPGVGRVNYLSSLPQNGGVINPEYSSTPDVDAQQADLKAKFDAQPLPGKAAFDAQLAQRFPQSPLDPTASIHSQGSATSYNTANARAYVTPTAPAPNTDASQSRLMQQYDQRSSDIMELNISRAKTASSAARAAPNVMKVEVPTIEQVLSSNQGGVARNEKTGGTTIVPGKSSVPVLDPAARSDFAASIPVDKSVLVKAAESGEYVVVEGTAKPKLAALPKEGESISGWLLKNNPWLAGIAVPVGTTLLTTLIGQYNIDKQQEIIDKGKKEAEDAQLKSIEAQQYYYALGGGGSSAQGPGIAARNIWH